MTFDDAFDTFICNRLDALAVKDKSCEYTSLNLHIHNLKTGIIATFGTAQQDLFTQLQEAVEQLNGQECEDAYKAGLLDGITLANRL